MFREKVLVDIFFKICSFRWNKAGSRSNWGLLHCLSEFIKAVFLPNDPAVVINYRTTVDSTRYVSAKEKEMVP